MGKHPNRVAAGKRVAAHTIPKTCPQCQGAFLGTGKQIYCARTCKEAAQLAHREAAKCDHCGKPIAARKSQRFCSDKCKKLGRFVPTPRPCEGCGAPFTPPRGGGKRTTCSPDCKTVRDSRRKLEARTGTIQQKAAQLAAELEKKRGE